MKYNQCLRKSRKLLKNRSVYNDHSTTLYIVPGKAVELFKRVSVGHANVFKRRIVARGRHYFTKLKRSNPERARCIAKLGT